MINMILGVLLLAGLFINSGYAAPPSSAIGWLMNEPASLFDVGIVRMRIENGTKWIPQFEKELVHPLKLADSHSGSFGNVSYSEKDDVITIHASLSGNPTRKICSENLMKYKSTIYSFPDSAGLLNMFVTGFFGHINYDRESRPKDLDKNISKLIKVSVSIFPVPEILAPGVKRVGISCTGPLTSDAITFRKLSY